MLNSFVADGFLEGAINATRVKATRYKYIWTSLFEENINAD